ncbi:hypothetical protein [Achromobacter xylosoxidans]|uniref:Uncharacterized protein n=1 Tax=Alcaligenes xylosoxydans xylosoxydans TaxID=85698 RepID=A0A424W5G4_ALCXX|nr:hypothetical protein [Achromobacter xylosoxidans]MBC9904802.1 hypothetical protein [Achromobacter xylosoxidans]MBD0868719.1 hypothetical protein [Achromobacter xylosoxidans]QNP87779.1 hypothetical protein IAG39_09830 [Achromobacter xylosoxidans]RPJ88444.1 hypothetical protein DY367_27955 [Achromobacter xylosoxidans]
MTDHTPAAQAAMQTALTDAERNAVFDAWLSNQGEFRNYSALMEAIESAVLFKLRAPVATTTDRAMLQSVLQDLENSDSVCPRCGHSDSCADMDVVYMIRDHLKAQVRAPVADERAIHPEIQAVLAMLDVPVLGYLGSHSGKLLKSADMADRFESAIPLVSESAHRAACEKIIGSRASTPVADERADDTLTQVYDRFGIGILARNPSTLMACLGNVIRRANCLSQVEQVLSVPTPPEPDDEGIWGEESLLRWGADEKGYAEHFKAALAEWSRRAALASAPVAGEARKPVAVTDLQGDVHWKHGRKPGIALYAAPQASEAVPNLPRGWQLALNLAIDAIENAAPAGQDWPVNWPVILHGLKELRDSLAQPQASEAAAELPAPVNGEARAWSFAAPGPVAAEVRVQQLEAARIAYAREFPPDENGDPDVGNIHANIRKLKSQLAALSAQPGAQRTGGSDAE